MQTRILALIPEAATTAICLDMAEAAAAAISDAAIEALHIAVDPLQLLAPAEEIDFQLLRERREGTAAQRAEATRWVFDDWVSRHPDAPISPDWKQLSGSEQDGLCAEAQRFDVLVVPRGTNADGAEAMHAALYRAHRPLFLAPRNWMKPPGLSLTERIVIAWNNTPSCRRATEGAMPWLKRSTRAAVLLINESEELAADVVSQFRSAGVPFTVVAVPRDDERLGDQIVTQAKDLGATLLVVGAHRHNMLIEWLVGHTTDQIMGHDDLPLFMAH